MKLFTTQWCSNCKPTKAIFIKLCEEYNIKLNILDADVESEEVKKHRIRSVPSAVLGKAMFIGAGTEKEIKEFLENNNE